MGLEFARRPSTLTPPSPLGGVPWMQKLKALVVAAQGYQRFPLSKPVVGQNIAVDAGPSYRASIPTWFLLIQLRFL